MKYITQAMPSYDFVKPDFQKHPPPQGKCLRTKRFKIFDLMAPQPQKESLFFAYSFCPGPDISVNLSHLHSHLLNCLCREQKIKCGVLRIKYIFIILPIWWHELVVFFTYQILVLFDSSNCKYEYYSNCVRFVFSS